MHPNTAARQSTPASLPATQGLFYVVTGFWPVIHIRSFEAVTGNKTDDWLVKAAGALIGVIGLVLLAGSRRTVPPPEQPLLAVGSAATLATVDVVYVKKRVIPPIYLADAAVEVALALAWVVRAVRGTQPAP